MYKKPIVAVDFFSETEKVIAKACQQSETGPTGVHLVHVLEDPMPLYDAYAFPSSQPFNTEEVKAQLAEKLRAVADDFSIPHRNCHIHFGSISPAIIDAADELGADLIVAGSHGRHGIGLLLMGSTSGSVLHHSKTDFLAVRVEE